MPKICQADGCNNPVFNSKAGYCKFHMYKADISKKKKREYKYTKAKEKALKQPYFGFKSQIELFNYLWDTQPHICFLTGQLLKEKDIRIFMHVLRKGAYTYFKLNPDNIRLGQPYVHDLVDNFKPEYKEEHPEINFDKWFILQDEMKIKYEQFKKYNLLS